MTLTTKDLLERLKLMDEITVMELLDISSEELVERFADVIQSKADQLERALEEETFEDGDYSDFGEDEF